MWVFTEVRSQEEVAIAVLSYYTNATRFDIILLGLGGGYDPQL
ncbi:hypothetical protein ACP6PL_17100 [Dapis sp. BLCC M126]